MRHVRGQGNIHFRCSADHEQDWQPYPVDPYSAICDDHTYINHGCQFFRIWFTSYKYREDCRMCRLSTKVIKNHSKRFSSPRCRRVTRRQVMRRFTSNGTDQCQNGASKFLTPHLEKPRSTRIVVAYPRPAFSATNQTNHAPISFDQQAHASQGRAACRNKKNCNTEVYGSGGLELIEPAREPASSRQKPRASLINAPRILPFRRSLLALVWRKQTWSEISFPLRNLPVRPFDFRTQGFSIPLAGRRSSCHPSSLYLMRTHCWFALPLIVIPRQCHLPLACHHLPKGTKLELARGAPGEHHSQPTIPLPRLNRPPELAKHQVDCTS